MATSSMQFSAVILAAGKGTRMKSALPKVMHQIASRPMIAHVVASVSQLEPKKIVIVTADGMDDVIVTAKKVNPVCEQAIQKAQLGTGDAVLAAQDTLKVKEAHNVLVLYGDTPLIRPCTLEKMTAALEEYDVVVLGMRPRDAGVYGRLVVDESGELQAIVEYKDANDAIRALNLCNSGVMAVGRKARIFDLLAKVTNNNASGEYYLTDVVAIARTEGLSCGVVEASEEELMGVNSRRELAAAEAVFQTRLRNAAMDAGVTMIAPESVFLAADTQFGIDVILQPNLFFGEGVRVGSRTEIRMGSHLEGATIGDDCIVGPFARLRPQTVLMGDNKVGNFVELKKTVMESGAQASHLSYLGDARIGEETNIGAGTITCNYDGYNKFETIIGKGAFIGSNTALVAPVTVGDGAIIGAGSVITEDVTINALALSRAEQHEKIDWAERFRARKKQGEA